MAYYFCDLPEELQTEILSYLDAVSLTRCAMTCKSIYETIQSASALLYMIQLHLDALEDGRKSSSHLDLIETIMRRRQAWRSLDGTESRTHQVQRDYAEEFVGGAFASMTNDYLDIICLPAPGNDEARTLHFPLNGIAAREVTMDPTQDLLVFLENMNDTNTICVHVRSLSTNAIHPQAQQSPLQFNVVPRPGPYWHNPARATFQIAYNILAVYFRDAPMGTRVLIWDWITSDLILDTAISFDRSLPTLRYGFRLLDPMYFIITCPFHSGSIRLYRLVRSPEISAVPIHLATFHFPPTSHGTNVLSVTNVAGPTEVNPPPHLPFMVRDEDRLHMLTVEYDRQTATGAWYFNLFLHQRVLLKYGNRALTAHAPLDIPWTDWGPLNTRFIESSSMQYAARVERYVHGQRVVFPGRNVDEDGVRIWPPRTAAYILDFSLAAVLFAKGVLKMPSSYSKGNPGRMLSPSIIRADTASLFLEDVETYLPCVTSMLDFEEIYLNYMIYADGIVGINMGLFGGYLLHIYLI